MKKCARICFLMKLKLILSSCLHYFVWVLASQKLFCLLLVSNHQQKNWWFLWKDHVQWNHLEWKNGVSKPQSYHDSSCYQLVIYLIVSSRSFTSSSSFFPNNPMIRYRWPIDNKRQIFPSQRDSSVRLKPVQSNM